MREVVVFLTNTPTAKGAGWEDNFTTLLTTRGQLINDSNSRGMQFGSIEDNNRSTLRVRFQSALAAALRSDTKIVISGITYTMNGRPKLVDQRKHLYEFSISMYQS